MTAGFVLFFFCFFEKWKFLAAKDLYRLFPCLSTPCRNGGTCVEGPALGMFACNCPLEIRALPYVDNICNVGKEFSGLRKVVRGKYTLISPKTLDVMENAFSSSTQGEGICEIDTN